MRQIAPELTNILADATTEDLLDLVMAVENPAFLAIRRVLSIMQSNVLEASFKRNPTDISGNFNDRDMLQLGNQRGQYDMAEFIKMLPEVAEQALENRKEKDKLVKQGEK